MKKSEIIQKNIYLDIKFYIKYTLYFINIFLYFTTLYIIKNLHCMSKAIKVCRISSSKSLLTSLSDMHVINFSKHKPGIKTKQKQSFNSEFVI